MGDNVNVCPWWLGYMLLNPVRRFMQNPDKILNQYVSQKMNVMDIGCAMGFFSLPLARLVGEQGKVFCIDLQEKMIETLAKRSKKAGLNNRIEARVCNFNSLEIDDIEEEIDFALAFALVHEVPDKDRLFSEIHRALKPGGRLLVAEPKGHVNERDFNDTVALAQKTGFSLVERPEIGRSYSVLLRKDN